MNASNDNHGARTRVFVYGTLIAGEPNHQLLRDAQFVGEARTAPAFELRDLGPYPAMVGGGQQSVAGEVYEVDGETLERLDRLEGHPSYYRRAPLPLADGAIAEAYLLTKKQVKGLPVIGSGSWREHRKERGI